MSGTLHGKRLGGALERLREAANIELPKLADEYSDIRNHIETSTSTDELLKRPEHFGPHPLSSTFNPLRDLIWTATGETGDRFWDLHNILSAAVEDFAEADAEAGRELDSRRSELEDGCADDVKEWTGGYESGTTPPWVDPGRN